MGFPYILEHGFDQNLVGCKKSFIVSELHFHVQSTSQQYY